MTFNLKLLLYVVCGMLLWAMVPMNPYGYYQLLRIIVFCFVGYLIVCNQPNRFSPAQKWTAIGVVILYNPIFKVHLGRPLWTAANLLTVIILIWITSYKQTNTK